MREALRGFFESRAGLVSAWRRFANEKVPLRSAWLFTLGSAVLVAFVVQLVSGIGLSLAYAPTPDHAHESVKAIQTSLAGGSLLRGLHHWGASAMVLLMALHMARTFWFGAYKKPRELNWVVGVALLVLVLAFGFTGYLLPWDQKAYWATVVGTKIPAALPVLGPAMSRLMAGGTSVGAYTLTRFYALHVVLLPLLLIALVGLHLFLLRRHGHAGPVEPPDPRETFFPYQAARDAVVGLLLVIALLWLAARYPAPLERMADSSDTSYVPRPDWYFLPLFQLLKYFKGPMEPLGTVVLPGLTVLLLALVPWLDRSTDRRPRVRKRILVIGSAGAAAVVLLLFLGAADAPKVAAPSALGPQADPPPDPHLLGGALAYEKRACASCHGPNGAGGPREGFALTGRPVTWDETKLTAHFREKSPAVPKKASEDGANDPDKDLPSLIAYVSALSSGPLDLAAFPPPIRQGGAAIDREDCRQCHAILGDGGNRGPALVHIAGRHDKPWLIGHFIEPKKFVAGSKMPSFKDVPEPELAAMADYLLRLP